MPDAAKQSSLKLRIGEKFPFAAVENV